MIWFLFFFELCNATQFGHAGDKLAGGVAPYLGRHVRPTDNGIAHRTLPMGSRVLLINPRNGRTTRTRVIDRGPFGRVSRTGKWYNGAPLYRRLRRARKPIPRKGWRGCVDMTPRVRRALRHNGFEPVIVAPIQPRKTK